VFFFKFFFLPSKLNFVFYSFLSGYFREIEGSYNCTACGVGLFMPEFTASHSNLASTNATNCQQCVAGTYQPNQGATSSATCKKCGPGKYQPNQGVGSELLCIACATGLYSNARMATSVSVCMTCAPGRFSETAGKYFLCCGVLWCVSWSNLFGSLLSKQVRSPRSIAKHVQVGFLAMKKEKFIVCHVRLENETPTLVKPNVFRVQVGNIRTVRRTAKIV
tara:strand:- start:230 stop:889 length:660 start_codon:yes stop_codon:yes gene_type:complete